MPAEQFTIGALSSALNPALPTTVAWIKHTWLCENCGKWRDYGSCGSGPGVLAAALRAIRGMAEGPLRRLEQERLRTGIMPAVAAQPKDTDDAG